MENSFICPTCADANAGSGGETENAMPVNNTAVQYLSALTVLSPQEARKLSIDDKVVFLYLLQKPSQFPFVVILGAADGFLNPSIDV